MVTRLESLPNEILMELFVYFNLSELYYGFFRLNIRFRELIQSILHLSVNVYQNDTELQTLFAHRITRMVVGQHRDVIDFKPYPILRSLVIHGVGQQQLEQIKSGIVPNLTYLSISLSSCTPTLIRLVREVFSGVFLFLRSVDFSFIYTSDDYSWSTSMSLRSISLYCFDPFLIPLLLTSCPRLSYLRVYVVKGERNVIVPSTPIGHHLKTLALVDQRNRMSLGTIDSLLLYTPHVKRLSLQFFLTEPLARLAHSLSKHVRHLRQFHCNITQPILDNTLVEEDLVQRLHPCFSQIHIRTKNLVYRVYTTDDLM